MNAVQQLLEANKAKNLKAEPILFFVKQLRTAICIPEARNLLKSEEVHLGALSDAGFLMTITPECSGTRYTSNLKMNFDKEKQIKRQYPCFRSYTHSFQVSHAFIIYIF